MPGLVRAGLRFGSTARSSSSSLESNGDAPVVKKARKFSQEHAKPDLKGLHKMAAKSMPKAVQLATLDMRLESPPLTFLGNPDTSTGALLSGQLLLTVHDQEVELKAFEMTLFAALKSKKPAHAHCAKCEAKVDDFFHWNFLKGPTRLRKGTHEFPFSYLLPGHLPATTHSSLGSIEYGLNAKAKSQSGDEFKYERELVIQRALLPGNERHAVRVFPPTSLSANVTLPPVIYPIGSFPIQFRMEGAVKRNARTQTRWQLKKLLWRIDEKTKFVSPACDKHSQKLGGENKGLQHEDVRSVGGQELKRGWKTDYSNNGLIEVEFDAGVDIHTQPVCDVEAASGTSVTHTFVVEVVVAEEQGPLHSPKYMTPTGAARILRMSFNILMTQREGLGISWDLERPPMYEDVPASPPSYTQTDDYVISSDHESIDELRLSP